MGIMTFKNQKMKNINIMQRMALLLICFGIFSCSQDMDVNEGTDPASKDLYITAALDKASLPVGLQYKMYIFWKTNVETDYQFKDSVKLTGEKTKMMFKDNELKDKDYRFLFIATSAEKPEINISDLSRNALNNSHKWSDVLISASNTLISGDNYSGILDKSGDAISQSGSIDGILTRMVGQIVLDIFRISGDINYPTDIVSGSVSSVVDRVFKVEAEYEGITRDIVFGGSGNMLDNNRWPDKYKRTHLFEVDNELKVSVPQDENGLLKVEGSKLGSARIEGIYCLPSTQKMRAKFTFHYYDTTPKCGNIDEKTHTHTADCFVTKTLELNLPQDKSDATLLSVFANYFTVNKAGIRLDRIIDLDQPGSFELLTTWGN